MPIEEGQLIDQPFLITRTELRQTKNGSPYIDFDARSEDGQLIENCKRWESDELPQGVMKIRATVTSYNGKLQLKVLSWDSSDKPPEDFYPQCPWPIEESERSIEPCLKLIQSRRLRTFTEKFVDFWSNVDYLTRDTHNQNRFLNWPGALAIHHSYRYGLVQHTVEVVHHAVNIAKTHNLSTSELDYVVCGALIHDIGKIVEYEVDAGVYKRSQISKAYGNNSTSHLIIGSHMLYDYMIYGPVKLEKDEFLLLQNIILSHHGFGEWSPVKPAYVISTIIHFADDVSHCVNRMKINLLNTTNGEIKDRIGQFYMDFLP